MKISDYSLGSFIREKREKKGFSQEALARKIDVSHASIYKIESDKVIPSFPTIVGLSKILEFSLDEIVNKLNL